MSLEVTKTELDGVLIIKPITLFEDFRGTYVETYNKPRYKAAGISAEFIQDDISVSSKNVLRGVHGDAETTKLVSCLAGKFYLVVVNNDPDSPQFRKWIGITLSDKNYSQVLIPPKFGNGHLVLSESAIFHYKQTTEYNREGQFTIKWDDEDFGIWWPISNPTLSKRDNFDE